LGSLLAALVSPKPDKEIEGEVRSILVIRPGGIGDAIFLLPFLRLLKEQRPEIAVDILAEKRNAPVFLSQPGLYRKVYCYDDFHSFFSLLTGDGRSASYAGETSPIGGRASHESRATSHYQVIIDSEQWHYLSALVAYFLNPAVSIGFASRPLRLKLFNKKIPYTINAYEIENFKNLFIPLLPEASGVCNIENYLQLDPELTAWANAEITAPSATLLLGASIAERRLTGEQISTIIRCLHDKNLNVLLLGGKDVSSRSEQFAKGAEGKGVKNYSGKISLLQNAALIKQSRLFIGPDSGLMHLAVAVGTPVVAIFGPGNAAKWAPRGERHTVISTNESCSPCTLFGYTIPMCKNAYPCLQKLDLNIIAKAVEGEI